MMTYKRFKEIWTTLVTNRPYIGTRAAEREPSIPASPHTVKALEQAADGNHEAFDQVNKEISQYDNR